MRAIRFLIGVAGAALLAGCDRLSGQPDYDLSRLSDSSRLTTHESTGEVALAEGGTLRFSVTSEVYRRWDDAQRGIEKSVQAQLGDVLKPESPSERTIDAAVRFLEGQPSARNAIERAGMNIREFVVTTVALEQEMRAAEGRGSREPDPYAVSMDTASFYRPDTSMYYTPPPVYAPYTPAPVYPPIDTTQRRVDTVYVDSTTRPSARYSPWDSLVRRGGTLMKRDTTHARGDTGIHRVRDSIVSSIIRRDSLRRANARRESLLRRDTVVRRDTVTPRDTLVWRDTTTDTLTSRPRRHR